jgi:hypothetical protein
MATERQIQASRANAPKSTGPITPEGKRISSRNAGKNKAVMSAAAHGLLSSTVVLKGESVRRFNDLATALILQFQPRNSAETSLVQTMIAARWRLLRMWGIQSAGFQLEMARQDPSAGSGAVLAENSHAFALQHRLEATYDRQYNHALAMLLKLRAASNRSSDPGAATDPPFTSRLKPGRTIFKTNPISMPGPKKDRAVMNELRLSSPPHGVLKRTQTWRRPSVFSGLPARIDS